MRLYTPAVFQGRNRKRRYFEGWYFKSVDAAGASTIIAIPGISCTADGTDSHAFIQFVDYRSGRALYFRYDVSAFTAERNRFEVRIGSSVFTQNSMHLDIDDQGVRIRSDLEFTGIHPWPVTLFSPGAMGWYRFVPFMECYHGVLSFDHRISGSVQIDGEILDMSGGRGYMEKDWGASMPSSWIWLQTNHFPRQGVSLFASIARIPWLGGSFTGFLIGLLYNGTVYRFATWTGACITVLEVTDRTIRIVCQDKRYRLDITTCRATGVQLPAPSSGSMTRLIGESGSAQIDLVFSRRTDNAVIYAGAGAAAGLECVGDMSPLINGVR